MNHRSPLVIPVAISLGAIAGGLVGWLTGRNRGFYSGLRSHATGFLIVVGAAIGFAATAHLSAPRSVARSRGNEQPAERERFAPVAS
jgi:hypothetical protein